MLCTGFSFLPPTTSFGHQASPELPRRLRAEHLLTKRLPNEPVPVLVAHSINLSRGQAQRCQWGGKSAKPKPRCNHTDESALQTFKINVVLEKGSRARGGSLGAGPGPRLPRGQRSQGSAGKQGPGSADVAPGRPVCRCPARLPPRTAAFVRGLRKGPESLT